MSTYTATIRWTRDPETDFARGQYSRAHNWSFDGGITLAASASPHIVPAPWSNKDAVDPEDAGRVAEAGLKASRFSGPMYSSVPPKTSPAGPNIRLGSSERLKSASSGDQLSRVAGY